jgi:hypothetical protein
MNTRFLPPLDEHIPPVEDCDCGRCEAEREYERQWLADLRAGALELTDVRPDPLIKRRAA